MAATAALLLTGASSAMAQAPSGAVDPTIANGAARQQLDAARQRWRAAHVRDYHFTVERLCFCAPAFRGPATIVVRNDAPVAPPAGFADVATVPRLHAIVRKAIDDRVEHLAVAYDARGVPLSIAIDSSSMIADDEITYRVTRFTVDRHRPYARREVRLRLRAMLRLSVTPAPGAARQTATLRCRGPRAVAGGYLSGVPAEACKQARAVARLLLSTPDPDRICTDIFGGEQTAKVTGSVGGGRVQRAFSRRNGCEIADWDTMGLLLGAAASPSRLLSGAAVAPSRLLVAYHRTGGFLGLDDRLSVTRGGLAVHTARDGSQQVFQLPAADLAELVNVLEAADFPSLKAKYLPQFPVSDGFTYTLTHRNKTVVTADGAIPAALDAPIAVLDRLLAAPFA